MPFTEQQDDMFSRNDHFYPLEVMSDGDILVADMDAQTNRRGIVEREWGPYILTRSGYIQTVPYHYRHSHGAPIPSAGAYMPQHDESRPLTLADMIEEDNDDG